LNWHGRCVPNSAMVSEIEHGIRIVARSLLPGSGERGRNAMIRNYSQRAEVPDRD